MTMEPKLLKFVLPSDIYFNVLGYFLLFFFHFRLFCCLLSCNHTRFTVFCWDPILMAL